MIEPLTNTITVTYMPETAKHKDLVFIQHLRNLISYYLPSIDNHQIFNALSEEASKYNYEGMGVMKSRGEDL